MQKGRRFISVVLSAAMIAGNMFSPVVAFAEDVGTDSTAQEQQSTPASETSAPETTAPETTAPPQTEAPDYTITLTDQDAFGLKYDQTHFLSQDKDRKTTTLKYKQGEEVDLDVTVNSGYQIDKITFQDTDIGMEEYEAANGLVYGFTWKDEDTLTFNMPAVNLFMKSAWHQLQTETTVQTDVPQTDAAQSDVASQETVAPSESAVQTDGTNAGQSETTATEASQGETQTPDTSAVIEQDGFPSQGAVIMLDEITIGVDAAEITPETKFDDVSWPQDTTKVSVIDNEVKAGTPGLYNVVYRVDESSTGKSWYAVRPVRVSETRESETQPQGQTESSSETESESSSENGDVPPAVTEAVNESSTEAPSSEMETETEQTVFKVEAPDGDGYTMEIQGGDMHEAGEKVTVTVAPEEGFKIDEVAAEYDGNVASADNTNIAEYAAADDTTEENVSASAEINDGSLTKEETAVEAVEDNVSSTKESVETTAPESLDMKVKNVTADVSADSEDPTSFSVDDAVASKKMTFIMPRANVVLRAKVSEIPGGEKYGINDAKYIAGKSKKQTYKINYIEDGVIKSWSWEIGADKDNPYGSRGSASDGASYLGSTKRLIQFNLDDGTTYTALAYCLEPPKAEPETKNFTPKNIKELSTSSNLAKAMFYLFRGPAWGDTINGINMKTLIDKDFHSASGDHEVNYGSEFVVTHTILGYFYNSDKSNWAINSSGNEIAASTQKKLLALAKKVESLPAPGNSISTNSVHANFNGTWFVSDPVTFNSNVPTDWANITAPAGFGILVGSTNSPVASAQIAPGQSFRIAIDPSVTSGSQDFTIKTRYGSMFAPYKLNTVENEQNLGFACFSDKGYALNVKWEPFRNVAVRKSSSNTAITNGNNMYSLAGARFQLIGSQTYEFTINADGSSNEVQAIPGSYTLREVSAPKGYKPVGDIPVTVVAGSGTQYIDVADEPITGTVSSMVNKAVSTGFATNKPTNNAKIRINYYDNTTASGNPKQSWVIKTEKGYDASGKSAYIANLDNAHLVSGSLVYGENTVPLGTVTIQEIEPPDGFELNNKTWTVGIFQQGDHVVYSYEQDQNGNTVRIENETIPNPWQTIYDEPTFGDLKIRKQSSEQGTTTDGDATFAGAEFQVINANDYDVMLQTAQGNPIHKGEVVTTITTGDDGIGQTSNNLLQTGRYTVKEVKAPEGYKLSDKTFDVEVKAKTVADYTVSSPHENEPERAGFTIRKRDLELAEGECIIDYEGSPEFKADKTTPDGNQTQGDATLKNAEFILVNRSKSSVKIYDGGLQEKVYNPGDTILTFKTDENGVYTSPEKYLPYGTYEIVETKAPEGYNLRGKNIDITFTVRETDDGTIKNLADVSAEDDVIRFDIEVLKFAGVIDADDQTDNMVPLKGAKFDIYLESNDEKPYLTITTDENGLATTADKAYPHGRLPYGKYRVVESYTPDGYVPVKDFEVDGTETGNVYDGETKKAIYKNDLPVAEWLELRKADSTTGKTIKVAGATFQILDKEGKPVEMKLSSPKHEVISEFTTTDEGTITLPQRLETGDYKLHEIQAPYGYTLNLEDRAFKVTSRNKWENVITWTMNDTPVMGNLELTKYDSATKKAIAGAVFDVYAAEDIMTGDGTVRAKKGDKVDTFTVRTDGTGKSRDLFLGKYYAVEVSAPEGYVLDSTQIPFELEYKDQNTAHVTVKKDATNVPTTFDLAKFEQPTDKTGEWTDEEPAKTLAGITFKFTRIGGEAADRNRAGEVFTGGTRTTGKDGKINVSYIATGTYSVKETQTLPGYVLDDTISYFTVDGDGFIYLSDENGKILQGQKKSDNAMITRKNQYTRWEFTKVDMNGEEIKGAKMQILNTAGQVAAYKDENGKDVPAEWVSDGTPHRITRLPLGKYVLHEEESIKGYTRAVDIPFEVTNTGVLSKVKMTNKKLIVKKLDVLGKDVKKAGLALYEVHHHEDGTKYLTEEPVEAWTSDGKQYDTSNLEVGHTYRLIEEKVPRGYVEAEPIEFTITDDLTDQTVTMMDKKVLVSKVNTKITMIAGAKLEVRDKEGGVVDAWTSDGTAYAVSGLKAGETYTLVETEAPEGYVRADSIQFTVTKNWFADDSFNLTNTQVFVTKTDVTGDNEIPGATLTVTDKETNKVVDKWVSGDKPHAISGLSVGGSYTLREKIAADGYVRASDIDFTVDDGFTVKTVKMVDKQVTMTKTDVTGDSEVPGAQITVTEKESGKVVDTWTSGTDAHPISGLEVGKTYYLTEVQAPDGYAIAETIEFTVPDDGQNQQVSMKDKRVTVEKLDVLGKPVEGAKLSIYELVEDTGTAESGSKQDETDKTSGMSETTAQEGEETGTGTAEESVKNSSAAVDEGAADAHDTQDSNDARNGSNETEKAEEAPKMKAGKLIDTWVSGKEAHAVNGLIVGHAYRLIEEGTPEGYATAQYRDFTVTREDVDQNIALIDRQVLVSKSDTTITMLPGAKLEVRDKDGRIIDNWTSDGTAHAVSGLKVGETYTLVETEAPEGYVLASPIEFTVSDKADANDELNMINKQVKVTKTDITGGKEIAGAHLTVDDKETGKTVDAWVSTETPHNVNGLEVGKTYILTERKPADGYVTAESIEFTVEDDFKDEQHVMKDDVTKIKISKQDITSGKELPGAQLSIKDKDGNEVEKWTSTDQPHYIEMLPIGTYTLTEIAAPSLYMKAEDIQFTVEDTGEIQTVTMKDKPTTVVIHKRDIVDGEGGNELPGAKLEVRDASGKVIDSWTSGTEPHEIAYLTPGTYTLTEITAPNGYDVAENVSFSVADNGQVQHVTMYDAPKEEKIDLTGKKETTSTPGTSGGGGSTPSSAPSTPVKTGDNTPIMMYIVLMAAGACVVVFVLARRRKKQTKQ